MRADGLDSQPSLGNYAKLLILSSVFLSGMWTELLSHGVVSNDQMRSSVILIKLPARLFFSFSLSSEDSQEVELY